MYCRDGLVTSVRRLEYWLYLIRTSHRLHAISGQINKSFCLSPWSKVSDCNCPWGNGDVARTVGIRYWSGRLKALVV